MPIQVFKLFVLLFFFKRFSTYFHNFFSIHSNLNLLLLVIQIKQINFFFLFANFRLLIYVIQINLYIFQPTSNNRYLLLNPVFLDFRFTYTKLQRIKQYVYNFARTGNYQPFILPSTKQTIHNQTNALSREQYTIRKDQNIFILYEFIIEHMHKLQYKQNQ